MNSETMVIQAPVGGAVSSVNREFYPGGQFMPVTGMFCGAKKQAKKAAQKFAGQNWATLTIGSSNLVTVRLAGSTREAYLTKNGFGSRDEAYAFCVAALEARAEDYGRRGLMAHPTDIVG